MTRDSINPVRQLPNLEALRTTRLIIPVYLPDLDVPYFSDGLNVLRLMLESLIPSLSGDLSLTVVDNGSCETVRAELYGLVRSGIVDQLVVNRTNQGKVDAVKSVLRGSFESLFIVADADVVFRDGWLEYIKDALTTFPELGMLGLHPQPASWRHASKSIIRGALAKRELKRIDYIDKDDLDRFAGSLGWKTYPSFPEPPLSVSRNSRSIGVGLGHFAFALRAEAVPDLLETSSRSAGIGVDAVHFELALDNAGWWCGSAPKAVVHHIGNRITEQELQRIEKFRALVDLSTEHSSTTLSQTYWRPGRQFEMFGLFHRAMCRLLLTGVARKLLIPSGTSAIRGRRRSTAKS